MPLLGHIFGNGSEKPSLDTTFFDREHLSALGSPLQYVFIYRLDIPYIIYGNIDTRPFIDNGGSFYGSACLRSGSDNREAVTFEQTLPFPGINSLNSAFRQSVPSPHPRGYLIIKGPPSYFNAVNISDFSSVSFLGAETTQPGIDLYAAMS